ncbi:hypothetical protein P837_05266 [Klebsiella pneumoniae UCI 34]|nr:hypothetical protein P837_05266 [Klebsiella pneumoniae UCI 34]
MAESLLSFDSDGYVRLFFAMAIIICGYGYVIMGVFIRDALSYILMLFGLTGLSALFSFMVFMDKNMWAGSPDLTISRSPPDICTGPCSFTPLRRTALKRVKVISRGRFSRSPDKVKTAAPATQRVMVKN